MAQAKQRCFGPVIRYDGLKFKFDPKSAPPGIIFPNLVWLREAPFYDRSLIKRILLYSHPSAYASQDFVGCANAHEDNDKQRRRR